MSVAGRVVERQSDFLAFGLADVEFFGELINLALSCGRDAFVDEVAIPLRVFSFRGVDAYQANFPNGVDLERVAIVDPADCAL